MSVLWDSLTALNEDGLLVMHRSKPNSIIEYGIIVLLLLSRLRLFLLHLNYLQLLLIMALFLHHHSLLPALIPLLLILLILLRLLLLICRSNPEGHNFDASSYSNSLSVVTSGSSSFF